jgi:ribosomal protein L10
LAISRKRKEELVAEYVDMLKQAKGVVVTEYRGMTMKHLDELRGKLREKNAGFTVTKNTLLKVALREVGMAVPDDLLVGPVALAVALEVLRAQLLGVVSMPLTQFVGLLNEPGRQLVAVIKAGSEGLVNVLAAYSQKEAA